MLVPRSADHCVKVNERVFRHRFCTGLGQPLQYYSIKQKKKPPMSRGKKYVCCKCVSPAGPSLIRLHGDTTDGHTLTLFQLLALSRVLILRYLLSVQGNFKPPNHRHLRTSPARLL